MQPDLDKLRLIMRDDNSIARFFDILRRAQMRGNGTAVRTLARKTSESRTPSREHFSEILTAMRLLESCGFGRLLDGGKIYRARFQWTVHPLNVVDLATNPHAQLLPHHILKRNLPPDSASAAPAGWKKHTFALRPGAETTIHLPADLTTPEARRLGHFLLSIVTDA